MKFKSLTALGLAIILSVPGFSALASGATKATLSMDATVKQGASSNEIKTLVTEQLLSQREDAVSITWSSGTNFSTEGKKQGAVAYSDNDAGQAAVMVFLAAPTSVSFKQTVPTIPSTHGKNASASNLLNYVNSYLDLDVTGDANYVEALGSAPTKAPNFTWKQCDKSYQAAGGTYTFTQTYLGFTLTQTVTVEASQYSIDNLAIDYASNRVNTTSKMQWALTSENAKWSSCSENMSIPSSWYGQYVYFRIPGTSYSAESEIRSLYIPEKAKAPSAKAKLTSTVHSVTVSNLWDFNNCEFRLGTNAAWQKIKKDSFTYSGLTPNTSYTVYIRTCSENRKQLGSEPVSFSVRTKAATETKVQITDVEEDGVRYLTANATVAPQMGAESVRGSLSAGDLHTFDNMVRSYLGKASAVNSTLNVRLMAEEGEAGQSLVSFNMPFSPLTRAITKGNFSLNFQSDLGQVSLDQAAMKILQKNGSNLSIQIQQAEPKTTTTWQWVKNQVDNGAAFYKVSVTGGTTGASVQYSFPFQLTDAITVDSVKTYFVDTKGKGTEIPHEYNGITNSVSCTLTENGYLLIGCDETVTPAELPFTDIAKEHWAYSSIQYCYNRGLFTGVSATQFAPNGVITKAEIIALLARLDGFDGKSTGTIGFDDVKESDWYAPYAQWARQKGIVTTSTFGGTESLQRQQIAKLIYTYLEKSGRKDSAFKADTVSAYDDTKSVQYENKTAVLYLRYAGIMDGIGGNAFGPEITVSRCQMAAIMQRLESLY